MFESDFPVAPSGLFPSIPSKRGDHFTQAGLPITDPSNFLEPRFWPLTLVTDVNEVTTSVSGTTAAFFQGVRRTTHRCKRCLQTRLNHAVSFGLFAIRSMIPVPTQAAVDQAAWICTPGGSHPGHRRTRTRRGPKQRRPAHQSALWRSPKE